MKREGLRQKFLLDNFAIFFETPLGYFFYDVPPFWVLRSLDEPIRRDHWLLGFQIILLIKKKTKYEANSFDLLPVTVTVTVNKKVKS